MPQVGVLGGCGLEPRAPSGAPGWVQPPEIPSAWRGGLVAGLRVWAGQLGVLAPWGAITIAAPGPPWAPTSICDTGVKYS